jgi:type III secretory pathway component EscV
VKYLQAINWIMLALGVSMTVSLAVVCLMYGIYMDQSPRLPAEFSSVLTTTLLCLAVSLSAAAAALGHRRHGIWRWPAEAMLVFSVVAVVWFYLPK